jgi:hypothetical protein
MFYFLRQTIEIASMANRLRFLSADLLTPANRLSKAMPEMTRIWEIDASQGHPEFKFHIREPPFTGDHIGLKTWGTAFSIAKKIEEIGLQHFGHLLTGPNNQFTTSVGRIFTRKDITVLEYVLTRLIQFLIRLS